jgi:nitroreductase
LLDAAVQAPSALNDQPWSFVVVQDADLLKRISDRAKLLMLHRELPPPLLEMVSSPQFNIFYNAGTLILICAKSRDPEKAWDCCFAAENLMLAAREMGLGTCFIGFAWPALEQDDIRKDLGIPDGHTAVAPVIVGYPRSFPSGPHREAPTILRWISAPVTVG